MRHRRRLLLLGLFLPLLLAGKGERGVLLQLDRAQFTLTARDLDRGTDGPTLRVALGSPAHPTPSGEFPAYGVVLNPGWHPGPVARALGAHAVPPSASGPLGAGKIPFARGGEIALHGGANPLVLGKPVSLGCVRALDDDLMALLDWLENQGALDSLSATGNREVRQAFRRPVRIVVR